MTTIKIVNGLVVDGPNRAVLPNDYVKGSFQGTAPVNVVAASTSAVNISTLAAGSILDGVNLSLNDLVLLKDQTASNQNGIYRIGTLGNTEIDPISSQRFTERNIQFINVFRGAVNAQTLWGNSTITTTFNGAVFSTPLSFYPISTGGSGGGVSSVSVVNANGLTGSVANPTTTPAITLGTSLSGIIKGTGTGLPGDVIFSTAVAGSTGSTLQSLTQQWFVKGNTGTLSNVSTPQTNALLDLQSTSKGLKLPVMTTSERDAVTWVTGDKGMIIINSTTSNVQWWDGSTWNNL
jgi:hypothetical protein